MRILIIALVLVSCASIPVKPYDSIIDPDVLITWEYCPLFLDEQGLLHVAFKNPEPGEPEYVEGIFTKNGNQFLLIAYRYKINGVEYIYALSKENRYEQVSPIKAGTMSRLPHPYG